MQPKHTTATLLPLSSGIARTMGVDLQLKDFLGARGEKAQLSFTVPAQLDSCDRTSLLLALANELPAAEFSVERDVKSNALSVTSVFELPDQDE